MKTHLAAIAVLLSPVSSGLAQTSTGTPTQLVNPTPRDCCECFDIKVNNTPFVNKPGKEPIRIEKQNGEFRLQKQSRLNARRSVITVFWSF